MKAILLAAIASITAATAQAQILNTNSNSNPNQSGALNHLGSDAATGAAAKPVPNPFDAPAKNQGGMDMMMEMDMGSSEDYGMEGMGGGMAMMDMGMEAGDMDMMGGGMGMMGGSEDDSVESRFRRGLQRAILSIGKAKSDQERNALRGYVRQALEKRYLDMIAARQTELQKLKQAVDKLADDLARRERAKDRVIEVQMQSVQLAAEGLLQLGDLGGDRSGMEGAGYESDF